MPKDFYLFDQNLGSRFFSFFSKQVENNLLSLMPMRLVANSYLIDMSF